MQTSDLLQSFMSSDNTVRKNAETYLEQMPTAQAFEMFLQGIQMEQFELAELASVLFSKTLLEKESNFKQMTPAQLQQVLMVGTQLMMRDARLSYLKRMSDLVVKVLLKMEQYDQMVQVLLQQAKAAQTEAQKQALMYFVEIMCEFAFDDDLLLKNAQTLNDVFVMYLGDQSALVRVSALKGMTVFLSSIEAENVVLKFAAVAPTFIQKSIEAIQVDQSTAVTAVQSISELVEGHTRFFKNSFAELLQLFNEVLMAQQLLPELRKAALHGLQTLARSSPVQMRKSDQFKSTTLPALMRMLAQVDEDDMTAWEQQLEDNFLEMGDVSAAAQDCLSKMAGDLSVKFLLPLFIPLIVSALQSQKWREQHAGLVAMGMLSEGAAKFFKSELDNIVAMLLPMVQSQNKRIIYDLLTCLAYLCQEFHPTIQTKFGQPMLELIVSAMRQTHSRKVQYRGVSCLVDFCRELTEDATAAQQVLGTVAMPLLELLWQTVESNLSVAPLTPANSKIAQEALTALSSMAACLKQSFAAFYDQLMPAMARVMETIGSKPEMGDIRMLLVECMGFVMASIATDRPQQFAQDAQGLMSTFLTLQTSLERDDPQHPAFFSFYAQVAEGLKTGFAPYLPQVMELVERAVRIDLGFSVSDFANGDSTSNGKVARVKLDLKFAGLKTLELNTSALEQKIEGAHTLQALVEACGKTFTPYLQRTAELVKEYMSFKNSRDIRETMMKTLSFMMMSCATDTEMAQVLNYLAPFMMVELQKSLTASRIDEASVIMSEMSDCLDLLRHPLLNDQLVMEMLNMCAKCMTAVAQEKEAVVRERDGEEADEEQEEQMKEDMADADELLDSVVNVSTNLMKVYGTKVEAVVMNNLMPDFYKFLTNKTATQSEVVNAVAFFNNVLPYCSEPIFNKAYEEIVKLYVAHSEKKDLTMQQNILFGFGNFAQKATNMTTVLPVVERMVTEIVSQPDAKSLEKVNSYETAFATLGKVGMFQSNPQYLNQFLMSLPHQQSDAAETHLLLLKEAEKQNPVLMQCRDQLLKVLSDIRTQDNNNPENEILCDEGRTIINRLLVQ